MQQRVPFLLGIAMMLLAAGCGEDKPSSPTQPSSNTPATTPTLSAPTADLPSENQQLDSLRPTLRVVNATSNQTGAKTYEFQVSDDASFSPATAYDLIGPYKVVFSQTGVAEGTDGKTSFEVPQDLQPATRFHWRARVRQGTTDGPWSATATFRTRIEGYNRAGELYDPLTNGRTVGIPVNNVIFTPGRGVTINSNDSHVRYNLVQTITDGEFSFEADGIQNDSPGDKTKMMSMYDGIGGITDHPWRCTVEKRDGGVIAWRFIAGEQEELQVDTVGNERVSINFNPSTTYFWRARWGGGFNLEIFAGGENGAQIYNFGKGLGAVYRPNPHVAYLGQPPDYGRGGLEDASVVGVTYRNVFIGGKGGRPKPASLGSAIERIR